MKFGTDGIRGVFGKDITADAFRKVANSLRIIGAKRIVLGIDTRTSGATLARAVCEGAIGAGMDVDFAGVTTTPMLSFITVNKGYDLGIMLTASHNPKEYNGLKVFNSDGYKLSKEQEKSIEEEYEKPYYFSARTGETRNVDYADEYIEMLKSAGVPLGNLKVVCDCADGATSKYAERLFNELGALYIGLSDQGNGENINDGSGALYPERCREIVLKSHADIGFSFDGDGDRMIAVLSDGSIVDGDRALLALVRYARRTSQKISAVCSTVSVNSALQGYLKELGVGLEITDVGDHNVTERITKKGLRYGSEQSGHIIDAKYLPSGDGLLAAVNLAKIYLSMGWEAFEYVPTPQKNFDIVCKEKEKTYKDLLSYKTLDMLNALPRIKKVVLRPSGTEPKVRVTLEGEPKVMDIAERIVRLLCEL